MKKFLILLLFLLYISCEQPDDTSIKVKTNYVGDYVVFFDNYVDTLKVFVSITGGNQEWKEEDLVAVLGELGLLKIRAVKCLGDAYPDCGILSASIYMGDEKLVSDEAGYGETEVNIEYGF